MTPKERQAMETALDALKDAEKYGKVYFPGAITALREALAGVNMSPTEQTEQEPIEGVLPCPFCGCTDVSVNEGSTFRWRYAMCDNCGAQAGEVRFDTLAAHTEAAEKQAHKEAIEEWNNRAAPVHTKDLTDDEIRDALDGCEYDEDTPFEITEARAVIAADRRKNK